MFAIIVYTTKTKVICNVSNRTASVASQIFSGKNNGLQTLQASWHPYSRSHLGVLSSDSVFRCVFEIISYMTVVLLYNEFKVPKYP